MTKEQKRAEIRSLKEHLIRAKISYDDLKAILDDELKNCKHEFIESFQPYVAEVRDWQSGEVNAVKTDKYIKVYTCNICDTKKDG